MRKLFGAIAVVIVLMFSVAVFTAHAQVDEDVLEEIATTEEATDEVTDAEEDGIDEVQSDVGDTLNEVSPFETWEMFSALLIPIVVGGIKQQGWTVQRTNGALFVVATIVTAAGLFFQGDLSNVTDWITTIMTIGIGSFAMYNSLYQFIPLPQMLEARTGGEPLETARYHRKA